MGELAAGDPAEQRVRLSGAAPALRRRDNQQRIPGIFQLLLGLYIILTGSLPTIIQALALGVQGGTVSEFALAMTTGFVRDLLLLAPVLILANHRLGILHPLLIAVVIWPLVVGMPGVIQDYGGWAGVLGQVPVETPYFMGLQSHAPATVWMATAKYNGLEILTIAATYAGFWFLKTPPGSRVPPKHLDTNAMRLILIGLIGLSTAVFLAFVYTRGGIGQHLTSLGHGRFRELAGTGVIMVLTDLGAIALYVWIAARPGDVRSPLFLACLAVVMATQFISNGSRSSTIQVPLMIGLIWAVRKQRVPWRVALILAPLLFVSLGLLGAVRMSSWSGQTAGEAFQTTGFVESFALAEKEVQARRAGSAQIPIVQRGFELAGGPLLGESYVGAILAFIPRSIWEDKPRGPNSLYAQLFRGAPKEGIAIPVSPTSEMYWNFGVFGVLTLSLLYGALIRVAYNVFWRHYPGAVVTVFYLLFVTTFRFSTNSIVNFEQDAGLLLLCSLAVMALVPKQTMFSRVSVARAPSVPLNSAT